jgi:hypothetical protein
MAEIDQEGNAKSGRAKVIDHLSAVFGGQFSNGFEFNNDRFETQEVGLVLLLKTDAFVEDVEFALGNELDILSPQFQFQALLVDRLQKPTTFFLIHFETTPQNSIGLLFTEEFRHFLSPFCEQKSLAHTIERNESGAFPVFSV